MSSKVEKENVVEVEAKEPTFSDAEIKEKVSVLKSEIIKNKYKYNKKIEDIAKEIAINSMEYLDSETYLWVMYAYSLKYQAKGNKNAEQFCMLRMRSILRAANHKERKPKALTFVDNSSINEFIRNRIALICAPMDKIVKGVKRHFAFILVGIVAIFFCVLVFLLKTGIPMALGFISILLVVNYFLSFKKLGNNYVIEQTEKSKVFCKDKELIEFDLPVYLS